jgi:hypothetical protein
MNIRSLCGDDLIIHEQLLAVAYHQNCIAGIVAKSGQIGSEKWEIFVLQLNYCSKWVLSEEAFLAFLF